MNTVWSMWMNYEHDFVIKVRSHSHKANVHSDNWLQPGQHSEIRSARSQSAVLTPVQEVCRDTLTRTFFIDNQKWSTKALTWLNNSPQWICGNAKTGKRGNTRQNWTLIHPRDSDALNAVEESVSTGSTYIHTNIISSTFQTGAIDVRRSRACCALPDWIRQVRSGAFN